MNRRGIVELCRRKFERNTVPTAPDLPPTFRVLPTLFDWEEYPDLRWPLQALQEALPDPCLMPIRYNHVTLSNFHTVTLEFDGEHWVEVDAPD